MTKHQLLLDSTPLSLAARLVALVAGHTAADLTLSNGPALTLGSSAAQGFDVLSALAVPASAASDNGALVGGATDAERAQIADWAGILAKEVGPPSLAFLQRLNAHLLVSSFLPTSAFRPTTIDYAVWASVVSGGAGAGGAFDAAALPNLARWTRAVVASIPRSGAAAEAFLKGTPLASPAPEVQLAPSNIFLAAAVVAAESKVRAPVVAGPAASASSAAAAAPAAKKGEQKAAAAAAPKAAAPAAAAAAGAKDAAAAKPAKEKKPAAAAAASSSSAAAAPAAAAGGEVSQVYRVDFRVGRITSVSAHPTEARLYVEQIDVGEASGGVRTVVSGLAEHFKPEELLNRLVVVMVNVKAGDMKGVESAGRVMVATSADGSKKELATPPEGAKVGEPITFANVPASSKPDQPIAPKRLHEIMKHLHTNAARVVQYADADFQTSAGPVAVPTIASGTVA